MMSVTVKRKQLSNSEISAFCAQLALIIKAGISVQEGLSVMEGDTPDSGGKNILRELLEVVEEGRPFAEALRQSGSFPKYVVDMVEIGETSGRLDEVLDSLCIYYDRTESIRKNIKNAVTYPAVMIVMMAVVIAMLVVNVLPIFNQVFRQLGSEMSGFAQGIMNVGMAMSRYSAVIVGVIVVVIAAALLLARTTSGRAWLERFGSSFVGTRRLSTKVASGRFASAMALMLSSGLDVDESIHMASQLIENKAMLAKIDIAKSQMAQGSSFADALVNTGIFSGLYSRMLSVGFKTGSVDTVMRRIAQQYEEDIDTEISNILSVLEPTLVAILSVIVGMILLSVMLPLMGVMSSIG
ncbi:MAG: type II secretion system F family protein [Angelakisella sp.]|nr:type II secretion system F family protein [Angelakisella sp.]